MKFTLVITKTELTLNGSNLDRNARMWYPLNRNPDVVRHFTILLQKEFKTGKAAWQYVTPELLDSLGLVYNGISYSTEYVDYTVDVIRSDRINEYL